ncbi:hypothetical protein SDC9_130226 [bioreactor metagenome]|uniref:Branched-chain-amino-acid transaminase n=1 Tax=bioreactor metagenome TaxID=1076179 RepID=A0A645D218_9ZZZZ
MSECISKVFIYNGEVKLGDEFEALYPKSEKVLYEVIRVIHGKPLFLKEHLERLKNSIDFAGVKMNFLEKGIRQNILKLIKENSMEIGNIKLIMDEHNTLVYCVKHSYPSEEMYNSGVKTILYFGERENPNAKVVNKSFRQVIDEKLKETNSYEAILVNKDGYITEGSKSNIFMLRENYVFTAPIKAVLPGITREMIIKACENIGLVVIEKNIHYKDLVELDGLFISGTSPKVLPINDVQGEKFNSANNKIIKGIMKEFDKIIIDDLAKFNYI